MPSLVNFQPLIDASKESARASQRSQEYRTRAMEQGFQLAGQALDVMGERGRRREKQFQSIFDYDLNKNASKEARGYLADKYQKIRRDGVNMFMQNRNVLGYGKLTPEQKIQIDNDLDSFKKEAELLNVVNQQVGNAEKLEAGGKEGIVVNRKDVSRYLELLQPDQNGDYDTEGMAAFLSDIDKSPTGHPFTDYIPFDPNFYLKKSATPIIKKNIKPDIKTDEVVTERNGKKFTKVYQTKTYGTEDERRDNLFAMLSSSEKQGLYEHRIGESLTEDERLEAIAKYGSQVPNKMSAYFAYDKADMTTGFEDRTLLSKEREAPVSKDRDGTRLNTIEETEIGWNFGTTPILITKKLKGKTYKNASIIAINKDPYTASVVVPVGKNEAFSNVIKKRAETEGRDLTNQETTDILQELMSDKKYKTIEVPLEKVYNEFKVGAKKRKLNLRGFEGVDLKKPTQTEWDVYLRQ